jgi:hypothetical protein
MLVIAKQTSSISTVLLICGIAGLITSVAGCIDFCKGEIS